MARSKWIDVSVDWVDWLEARVEALIDENARLLKQIEFIKKTVEDLQNEVQLEVVENENGVSVRRVLVHPLSMSTTEGPMQ
jgi:hypothetical protein